jgi:acetyl esterase
MTSIDTLPTLPGRLGSPGLQLKDDPRADPRMLAAMAPLGLDVAPAAAPVDATSPIDEILEYSAGAEEGFSGVLDALFAGLPPVEGVTSVTEVIEGVDGNPITLYIHRPTITDGPLPCIVHTHGGGMVMLSAADASFVRWRDELAASGLVVIGVEFRNAAGKLGTHAFPAGLNDCASGARWAHAHRDELGISAIVISGESGGGNLSAAVALKAKAEGWLSEIDGVYSQCPYISNAWAEKSPELPSLFENDDYFLNVSGMGASARAYDPEGVNASNPLAWPLFAEGTDLAGLPPHVISVNQLDPLRDEGLRYAQKLLAAGVSVVSRTVNGTCHAGDSIFRGAMPDVYAATIRDINGFASTL